MRGSPPEEIVRAFVGTRFAFDSATLSKVASRRAKRNTCSSRSASGTAAFTGPYVSARVAS